MTKKLLTTGIADHFHERGCEEIGKPQEEKGCIAVVCASRRAPGALSMT